MEKLIFKRTKYGPELLIDASSVDELDLISDTLIVSFYVLIFLEEASGWYGLDDQTIALSPNMVLFIKPSQISYVPEAKFIRGHFLFFEGDFLDEFFSDQHFIYKFGFYHNPQLPPFLLLNAIDFQVHHNVAIDIWQEIKNLTPDSHHVLRAQIYYLLVKLNRLYGQAYGSDINTLKDPRILRLLKILSTEIRDIKGVQELSDRLQISRVHLNNLCQKYFSKTAHQTIREHLFSEVKKEIRYSKKGLSEIAYDFNFSAPSHFTRFFKQMSGLSPLEYRASLSNW